MLLVLVSLVLRNPELDGLAMQVGLLVALVTLLRESSRSGVDVNHRHRKAPLASGKWFISVGRIRRIGSEKRSRLTGKGLMELEERAVSGIWIRQEDGIWQILTEPIRIADGNHFVVNTVDYKSGLTNTLQ
jgi:hypothetical protein